MNPGRVSKDGPQSGGPSGTWSITTKGAITMAGSVFHGPMSKSKGLIVLNRHRRAVRGRGSERPACPELALSLSKGEAEGKRRLEKQGIR